VPVSTYTIRARSRGMRSFLEISKHKATGKPVTFGEEQWLVHSFLRSYTYDTCASSLLGIVAVFLQYCTISKSYSNSHPAVSNNDNDNDDDNNNNSSSSNNNSNAHMHSATR
jgi:hypothetical protein